jgi:hypothetical protein
MMCLISTMSAARGRLSRSPESGAAGPRARARPTWVLEQPEQLDLAQDTRSVRDMLENVVDLLDRDLLAGVVVRGRADHAVAALANDLLHRVPVGLAIVVEEVLLLHAAAPAGRGSACGGCAPGLGARLALPGVPGARAARGRPDAGGRPRRRRWGRADGWRGRAWHRSVAPRRCPAGCAAWRRAAGSGPKRDLLGALGERGARGGGAGALN